MYCGNSDRPADDFDRWDTARERRRARLPKCCHCDEHIQQETAVCIDGNWYCDKCLEDYFTQETDIED